MTSTIGPVTVDIIDVTVDDAPEVEIVGGQLTQVKYDQLKELFALAKANTLIREVLGGRYRGFDLTDSRRNTHYCTWDSKVHLPDGWYLLRSQAKEVRGFTSPHPFSARLFFLGSEAIYQPALALRSLTQVTNDWNI